jgi:transposase
MEFTQDLAQMDASALRDLAAALISRVAQKDQLLADKDKTITVKQLRIDQLTYEMATLKRWRFARRSEQIDSPQRNLLEDVLEEDLAAISVELEALREPAAAAERPIQTARRSALPASLPRREIRHEPEDTRCGCGCTLERIGEDVSEKLDYVPGLFTVERHVRGKWVCHTCERLIQAPVPAQVIDKGIPTAGLLAQVLVAKYADHLPLYRQEGIFERAGCAIARSTLEQWVGACGVQLAPLVAALRSAILERPILHADETPVPMLKPGHGRTHKAYLWSYGTTEYDTLPAVVYDFCEGRSGDYARAFLGDWSGTLVCDDYAGYKALFSQKLIEAGCMAHARRKFNDLLENQSSALATEALELFGALYKVEREAREQGLDAAARGRLRKIRAGPITDTLHAWLIANRLKVPDGSATAKAIDYSLKRWTALMRYLDDGEIPIDNNWVENRIRPVAIGRANWLFAGSLRAGQRAANVMSLIQSAKLNGHDPYRYLNDVLERLPSQPASRLEELLPHHWLPRVA